MKVVIRKWGEGDDIDALTLLVNRAYEVLKNQGLNYVGTFQDSEITKNRMRDGECWIALIDGNMVGSVILYPAGFMSGCPYYRDFGPAVFGQFAVDPDFQGRGIGRALIDTIENKAREMGAKILACDTSELAFDLISIYEKWGFKIVGEADWRPKVNYKSVILAKAIS
ncbi:MAG: GNAT family N-acetyltransferase [Fimbriimonadaceae bacterium]